MIKVRSLVVIWVFLMVGCDSKQRKGSRGDSSAKDQCLSAKTFHDASLEKDKQRFQERKARVELMQEEFEKPVTYGADSVLFVEGGKILLRGRAWVKVGTKLYNGVLDEHSEIVLDRVSLEILERKGVIEVSRLLK